MVYDIIIALILILCVVIGVRRGAARSLCGLLMSFLAYTAATFLGKWISNLIYQNILRSTIHDTVVNTVSDFSHQTLDDALTKIDLSGIDIFNLGLNDSVKGLVNDKLTQPIENISANAGQTAETVVEPIVIGIMSFFFTILLFIILYVLLRKLVMPLILGLFKLPIIRQLNMILGGVIGVAEAFLIVSMLAYLLKLVIPQISTNVSMLQESTIYNSFIFKLFYDGNIFSTFASWLKI